MCNSHSILLKTSRYVYMRTLPFSCSKSVSHLSTAWQVLWCNLGLFIVKLLHTADPLWCLELATRLLQEYHLKPQYFSTHQTSCLNPSFRSNYPVHTV